MQARKSTTTGANGAPTGEDEAGGGESEPANDPNKASLNSNPGPITLNNPIQLAYNPSSPPGSSKFPKSPKSPNGTSRPQISVHIQPATPKSSVALPPGSVTDFMHPRSAGGYSAHPNSSAHDAVQSWVQSQGAESATADASSGQGASKRDSGPATSPFLRNRRPSDSSQKSGKEKDILRPPSAAGSASGGGFSLSQLLSTGPKLSRRNSASSKKSVSSGKSGKGASVKGGSVKGGSNAGDSALESKYGIHGKLTVGKGATSIVRLAHKWDRTDEDRLYAVKEFRPRRAKETERDYVKKLTSEFCISSSLRHSNIVETVDLMQDQDGRWCEVMEFCPGGDLYAAIRKGGMSPAEVECSFKQILTGVGYLHQQGVAHRDLKPENLFFDARGQVKIGDFGASTVFRLPWEATTHKSSGLCGSEPYIAPEQFTQQQSYDARLVDVWACGIVYYCLHFSELPWSSAQVSDKTYAQYAQQCASPALSIAGIPFLKHVVPPSAPLTPAASGPGTPARQSSSASTPTTASLLMSASGSAAGSMAPALSRKETEREQHKEQTAPYPATIQHLSPRACRPVLRRMLEPKPELRVGIDDLLRHPWVQQIEVCIEPGVVPKHIHPTPVATAAAGGIVAEK